VGLCVLLYLMGVRLTFGCEGCGVREGVLI
jgi:hypothetical protein